ncbi:MAG TPA: 1-acyl-sn-glycerol-3-phosphate acyltransferase [Puia sp.]|nr:1-acyl-sn-glycerol-3-phosphate acyltransferase [Puia sp.]
MEKMFIAIYKYFEKNRLAFFISFGISFLLVAYFALQVRFEEDISKVLPKDKKIEKLNQVFQNSKFIDKLVVMVSLKDTAAEEPDSLVAFADKLASTVQAELGPRINKINYGTDDDLVMDLFNTIDNHLPIYLSEKDYRTIDTLMTEEKVKATLSQNFRTLTSPAGIALKSVIAKDPLGISFIALKKLQELQYDKNFELYDGHVITKDQKTLLIFITPAWPPNNTAQNAPLLQGIDRIIDSLSSSVYKNTTATYFGAAAAYVANALQLRKDTLVTQGLTVVILIVFLGVYFRKKTAPFIILIPVLFGSLFALSAIYFINGSISVIALGTGSVVLGIAVNYSLHLFNHYRHTKSIEQVIKDLALPLTVGSFTTIGGFLCLEFAESDILKDLGLFSAFSLIGASLCSLIFLPQFIASKKEQKQHKIILLSWIDKFAAYNPEYNKFIVIGILMLTGVFAYKAGDVSFESDLLRMNYMPDKLKQAEAKLNKINEFSLQSVYLVTEGKDLNEALVNNEKLVAKIEQLKERNIVKKYSGISSFIISDSLQRARIKAWSAYWTPEKKQQLLTTLRKEGLALGYKTSAFDSFSQLLDTDFQLADEGATTRIRKTFLDDFITEKPGRSTIVTLVKCARENKATIYKTFENDPNSTVIDKQYLTAKFVEIINYDFTRIAVMSSLLVFFVLLLTYGRIELTLVSFIPMFIGWIWILGIMGILGIQFNIINIIISALIFGLGDDYSLYIMDGLLQEYKTGKKNLSSFKSSIFLSAITTIAGLGVLIFAKHPALRSIALISIIGISCVVLMAQILIPFLFNILIKNRVQKQQFPWTLSGFLLTIFSFAYFVLGSILLTITGLFFGRLNPMKKVRRKLIYHTIISKFIKSMIYLMANVKKQVINTEKEDFSRPAIVVCNHQSFLDSQVIIMLHPKLILFTNKWVWNSPVFGGVVRLADYYPIERGAEPSIELLAERVKEGYSIVVFPEGTRSLDESIGRFHKGAFYLAEKLNLDILPIIIEGTGYTITKGDFLLKNGRITLKILPRIKPDDTHFGIGYSERTKKISHYFRDEFRELCDRTHQTAYFREKLIYNYLYKGPVLEWYMKIKLRLEKNYQPIHELLPKKGMILDIGCGYGFMSYMLQFVSPQREITGIDYDEEKIETANNCFSKNERINFAAADAMEYAFEDYDAIILADMLHYLQPAQQTELIEKCIRHLRPGGTILIRDGNKDLVEKHKATKLTEFFSTKVVGFNRTSGKGLSFISGKEIESIATERGMKCEVIDSTKYTSNVFIVLKQVN